MIAVATYWKLHKRDGSVTVVDEAEKRRRDGLQRPGYMYAEPAKLHSCDICGKRGPWTDTWSWYGSYAALDDGKPVINQCSDECRAEAKRRGLVPRNAAWSDE